MVTVVSNNIILYIRRKVNEYCNKYSWFYTFLHSFPLLAHTYLNMRRISEKTNKNI